MKRMAKMAGAVVLLMASWVSAAAIKQVECGWNHSMFLTTSGILSATGENAYGQLGDGTKTNQFLPVQVMSGVASISTGDNHTMILKMDGSLWATGNNNNGQLGDGTTLHRYTPVQIMSGVASVSAGRCHTMIIKTDGTLWGTGDNNDGQLGNGTTSDQSTPVQIMSDVASVSAGTDHTMIIKTDGTLYGTGRNSSGQLGDGTTEYRSTPVQIMSGVASVSTGFSHTMILKMDGTLWATGNNSSGQLGDATTTNKSTPVQIKNSIISVSTGSWHTLMVNTDGALWGTGYNEYGQIGDGTTTSRSTPVQLMSAIASVSAGSSHSISVKKDGTIWGTGYNQHGQIGDGTTSNQVTPQKLPLLHLKSPNPQTIKEDYSITITPEMTNGQSLLGNPLSLIISSGSNFSVSGTTVTPAKDYHGTLTVPVRVTDGTDTSAFVFMSVAVTPVNDAPTLTAATPQTLKEDTPIKLWVIATNAADVDNTTLNILVGTGNNYTVSGTTVTPAKDFNGTLTVPVRVTDGIDTTASVNMIITVTPVKDKPTITTTVPQTVEKGGAVLLSLAMTNGNSVDGLPVSLIVSNGLNYTVSGTTVTPNSNFTGNLKVPVRVTDGIDTSTAIEMNITVFKIVSISTSSPQTTDEDQSITLTTSMTDGASFDKRPISLLVSPGTNYSLSGRTITPKADFNGTIFVPVQVTDGTDTSASVNMIITVTPVNDAPTLTSATTQTIKEDRSITLTTGMTDGKDVDGEALSLVVSTGDNYSVSGTTVTPKRDFNGTLTVPVQIVAGTDKTAPVNMTITVNEYNLAPSLSSAKNQKIGKNSPFTLTTTMTNAADGDSDPLTLLVLPGSNYTVSGTTITPNSEYEGTLLVGLMVNDGKASSPTVYMMITVDPNVAILTSNKKITSQKFLAVPNPVLAGTESVTLAVPETIRGKAVCSIFDVQGNLLDEQEIVLGESKATEWDLTNRAGVKVGSGTYVAILEATLPDGSVNQYKITIGVQR